MKPFSHLRAILLLKNRDEIQAITDACLENRESLNFLTFTHIDDALHALNGLKEARLQTDILVSEHCFLTKLESYLCDEAEFAHLQFFILTKEAKQTQEKEALAATVQRDETPLNNLRYHKLMRPTNNTSYANCMRTLKAHMLHT